MLTVSCCCDLFERIKDLTRVFYQSKTNTFYKIKIFKSNKKKKKKWKKEHQNKYP